MHGDDAADLLPQLKRHAGAPQQQPRVHRASARVTGLADAPGIRVDHCGVGLGDVVQQGGEEQHKALLGAGLLVGGLRQQGFDHQAGMNPHIAFGVVGRVLWCLGQARQGRNGRQAGSGVHIAPRLGDQLLQLSNVHIGMFLQ